MAAVVSEKCISQRFKTSITEGPKVRELTFNVKDAADAAEAEVAFIAAIGGVVPASYTGLPLSDYDGEEVGGRAWDVRATYGSIATGGGAVGETRLSFNTSGATQHISQGLELMALYGASAAEAGVTIGNGEPIGATKDGVDGADIPVAIFEFETTLTIADADVDEAYVSTIADLTGTTNASTSLGYDAGEVLFLGASGQQVGDGPWDISFRFARSKNTTGITIGSISGIAKNGWELLDVRYKTDTKGTGAYVVLRQVPYLVLVHRVFEEGNHSALGI